MMTRVRAFQNGLFAPKDLGARVPADHLLRRLNEFLDLDFVYDQVASTYGAVGQESIPPVTIMKLMILLTLYKVEFERELFRELPMRIDWLWFLGYDLSSVTPNHSVLSKARKRWGTQVFEELFVRSIALCIQSGLVDGRELLGDSSLIDANASVDSLFRIARGLAASASSRLDEPAEKAGPDEPDPPAAANSSEPKYRSSTDPDATGAKRRGEMRVRPRYQTHRGVDSAHGVITATLVGPGHQNEAQLLEDLVIQHTEHTGRRVETITADSKYGTADNLEFCEWNQITAYINPLRNAQRRPKEGTFTECCFRYDEAADVYVCPAGQTLRRTQYRPDKDAYRYSAPATVCRRCPVRVLCTEATHGRTVSRQVRQPILDRAIQRLKTPEGQRHRTLRKWMMEGSFAHSVRLGYKRARGRGLRNMKIQDYLVAGVQNLLILLRSKLSKSKDPTLHPGRSSLINAIGALLKALTHTSDVLRRHSPTPLAVHARA